MILNRAIRRVKIKQLPLTSYLLVFLLLTLNKYMSAESNVRNGSKCAQLEPFWEKTVFKSSCFLK